MPVPTREPAFEDDEAMLPRPDVAPPWVRQARAWVIWFGAARLVATSMAIVAITVGGWWLLRSPRPPTEAALPYASTTVVGTSSVVADVTSGSSLPLADAAGGDVTVHVAGAVMAPGVYTLAPGSLVNDAIDRAGGATRRADLDAVNLAAELSDGAQVFVPEPGEVIPAAPVAPGVSGESGLPVASSAAPVDLNTANAEQLDTLPGVGPATAAAIMLHREQNGPFAAVDDLEAVPGIGPAKLEAVRELVSV